MSAGAALAQKYCFASSSKTKGSVSINLFALMLQSYSTTRGM